jgi:hypothetical protein
MTYETVVSTTGTRSAGDTLTFRSTIARFWRRLAQKCKSSLALGGQTARRNGTERLSTPFRPDYVNQLFFVIRTLERSCPSFI